MCFGTIRVAAGEMDRVLELVRPLIHVSIVIADKLIK